MTGDEFPKGVCLKIVLRGIGKMIVTSQNGIRAFLPSGPSIFFYSIIFRERESFLQQVPISRWREGGKLSYSGELELNLLMFS